MKILYVIRQYHPAIGGAERFVADLSTRLAARGHQVEVVTLNKRWRDGLRLPDHEIINGITVHRIPYIGRRLFFVAPKILSFVNQFDLIHVHHTDFFLDCLAATRFIHHRPLVVSTHGGFFHTDDHAALKRLYFALVTQHSLRVADVIVPNSLSDEKRFARYGRQAIRIDNAIDNDFFSRGRRQRVRGRMITVGRLVANKNVKALLEVFAIARAQRSDLTLSVVGDGERRGELEECARRLGIGDWVKWLGEIDDQRLVEELSSAEIFLSAATHEAFGLALLEAMAAGCVPVVNNIEAFRDVIEDGRDGFLANYANAAEAASTLLRVCESPLDPLSSNAKIKAALFDWDRVIKKFERVYEDCFL
ncbi:MAG: glycosyltransferase family 4 protein [Chloroflexi bacterium]|nr:glycosyltransferase family 4 protein [Chloroflexota bacterium]